MAGSGTRKLYWKELVLAFSMANLILYSQWGFLEIHTNSLLSQYENESPYPATYLAMLLNFTLATVVFYWALTWTKAQSVFKRFFGKTVLWAGFFFILNTLRQLLRVKTGLELLSVSYVYSVVGWMGGLPIAMAMIAALLYGMTRYRTAMLGTGRFFLHVMFPVALFHAGWVGYKLTTDNYGTTRIVGSHESAPRSPRRVVFIVFDTMEERSSFSNRPVGLELPNFDAFRAQSVYGTQVFSPGARTQYSLTAFITGKMIRKAVPESGNDLWVTFDGESHSTKFSELPTVFTAVTELRMRSALVGWYHPYCRMLGYSMSSCHYFSANEPHEMRPRKTLGGNLRMLSQRILGTHPKYHAVVGAYQRILAQAKEDVANSEYNLVFVHFPIPHLPGLYDRKQHRLAYRGEAPTSEEHFWGNLALSDIALGELRSSMEAADLWDSSSVLITSDHWWWHGEPTNQIYKPDGTLDYRVPFMVKVPNQREPFPIEKTFNNVLSHDLMLDLLKGKVEDPASIVEWIEQKRETTPLYPLIETNIYG